MADNNKNTKSPKEESTELDPAAKSAYQKVAKDQRRNSSFSRSTGKTPVKIIKETKTEDTASTKEKKSNQSSKSSRKENTTDKSKTDNRRNTNRRNSSRKTDSNKKTIRSTSSNAPSDTEADKAPKKIISHNSRSSTTTKSSSSRSSSTNSSASKSKSTATPNKSSSKSKSTTTNKTTTKSTSKTPTKSGKTMNQTVTTTHAAVDPAESGPNIRIRQTVAILIDGNNIEKSIHSMLRNKKTMLDFDTLIPKLLQNRGLNRLIYFREGLNISEKLAERLLNHYHGSVVPCHKSADIPLTITATQIADKVDTVIILSGDSDYVELVRHMKSRGVRVEIAAVKRTTASILIEEADHYVPIVKSDCFTFK